MTLSYEQSLAEPLSTDALVESRVSDLIGRASRRQLWLLFLDHEQYQLPTIVPLDDLPAAPPTGDDDHLSDFLAGMVDATAAASLIIVLERYGAAELTPSDLAWTRALHDACDTAAVPLRAMLLSHRGGVRWVAQDDYRY